MVLSQYSNTPLLPRIEACRKNCQVLNLFLRHVVVTHTGEVETMLLEFTRLLGLGGGKAIAFDPAKDGVILIICGVVLAVLGYKAKGVFGSIVALLLGAGAFLYLKGFF